MTDHLHLDRQLCFLLYAASRKMVQLYRPLLDELGLTYPQYLVMLVLWQEDSATVKELGERLYLDSGTLTPLLKRLESEQLVTRERDREDERRMVISLTEQGRTLKHQASRIPEQLICKTNLTNEEYLRLKNEFESLLRRLHTIDGREKTRSQP